jgi:hypothetical protein
MQRKKSNSKTNNGQLTRQKSSVHACVLSRTAATAGSKQQKNKIRFEASIDEIPLKLREAREANATALILSKPGMFLQLSSACMHVR